jgi:hypothetical protein
LEEHFRVEDLQKILKEFNLPVTGRKAELNRRVRSLLDYQYYDDSFIDQVKVNIKKIYYERTGRSKNGIYAEDIFIFYFQLFVVISEKLIFEKFFHYFPY